MKCKRRSTTVAVTGVLALSLAACSGSVLPSDDEPSRSAAGKAVRIGLLLPEKEATRYEKFDRPIIEKRVKKLTDGRGEVVYANAGADAARQRAQITSMISQKVDALILDSVDAKSVAGSVKKAKAAGIHVIAYDRLAEGPVDGYVTFDNEFVGELQGRELLKALDGGGSKKDKIVVINGAPTDPNAAVFKRGALSVLNSTVQVAKSYDTQGWSPARARAHMSEAIKALGADEIAGVYSANDGMAGGAISALKSAGLTELPPVTGQDAELPAVQRIVSGEQYMTVYKPYPKQAEAAAEMAVSIAQNRMIAFEAFAGETTDSESEENIPTHLVQVRALTQETIKSTVIKDGIYKVRDICKGEFKADCAAIGLD
ncbi:D-xylose-binding periplasmic protein precursor [Streptomyces sp. YIM 130001]|uniref:sugar ABC transporter substrate-binding protein n=1 Tax=Streptomyces sp. YIM 130001 TaxID=2259644 RepID=UPI000E6586DA|nr:substrate-binding domain-containing protein [Streptomyces sp. YIM 130001]RII14775.1 D-xylose-binding periplasmic protein precursor [Streptomyces sp. YIM 130001]